MAAASSWRWLLVLLPLAVAVGFGVTLVTGLNATSSGPRAFPDLAPDHGDLGRRAYAHCLGCHGPAGQGVAGYSPPLAGSAVVQGPPEALLHLVLRGVPASTRWNQIMPGFADRFSDAELAALLTHARRSWGNGAAPITPAQVAAARWVP